MNRKDCPQVGSSLFAQSLRIIFLETSSRQLKRFLKGFVSRQKNAWLSFVVDLKRWNFLVVDGRRFESRLENDSRFSGLRPSIDSKVYAAFRAVTDISCILRGKV